MLGEFPRAKRGPRQLDHRADAIVEPAFLSDGSRRQLDQPFELRGEADQRMHDLDLRRLRCPRLDRVGCPDDRPNLHLVDLRPLEAEAAAASSEHRVRLAQRLDPLAHGVVGHLGDVGQELVQRRIEQADGDREPGHRLEDPFEVGLLHRQESRQRGGPVFGRCSEDHLPDDRQPISGHEHVLGSAEPDALGAVLQGTPGVLRSVGVGVDAEAPFFVGPLEDRLQVRIGLRLDEWRQTLDDPTGSAVDRERVALGDHRIAESSDARVEVDLELGAACDAGFAEAARHHCSVRRHPASGGEDASSLEKPMDVVGRGLGADEQDALARSTTSGRRVGVEHGGPCGRAG